jgi:hypothetical protein
LPNLECFFHTFNLFISDVLIKYEFSSFSSMLLTLQANEVIQKEAEQVAKRREIDEKASQLAREEAILAEQKIAAALKGDEEAAAAVKAKAEADGKCF